jgi:hypothetical protein
VTPKELIRHRLLSPLSDEEAANLRLITSDEIKAAIAGAPPFYIVGGARWPKYLGRPVAAPRTRDDSADE